jgi:hypothetical protein
LVELKPSWLEDPTPIHPLSSTSRSTQIKFFYRSLDGFTEDAGGRQDLEHFQQSLDNERSVYNQ